MRLLYCPALAESGTQKLGFFGLGGKKKEEDAPQGKSRASPPKPGSFGKKESGTQTSRAKPGLFGGGKKQESGTQALKSKKEPKAQKSGTQPSSKSKPGLLGTLKLSINKGRRDQKTVGQSCMPHSSRMIADLGNGTTYLPGDHVLHGLV